LETFIGKQPGLEAHQVTAVGQTESVIVVSTDRLEGAACDVGNVGVW
jgi:hypothetical protein